MSAETTVNASEARLRAVLDHSPSSIFVKDMKGRYLLVNEQWARLTGVKPVDAIGRSAVECWPDEAESIGAQERKLLDQETSLTTDECMKTIDGVRDFIVVRFLLRDGNGSPYAIVGIATDITERKRIEHDLAARDRLLETVRKASPDIITVMDRSGRVRQVSDASRKILGYGENAPSRGDMSRVVHPDDLGMVNETFARLLGGAADKADLRYRARHADGHWVTLDSSAQALADEHGAFAGAVVVTRDVTSGLASETRLYEAREAAEAASEAKSEFLSRMSHELRTPLNSVLGFAQLLRMDDLPTSQSDAVNHILAAGRHLLDLIDEVLDIARIESGHLELAMVGVPVAEIAADAVEITRPLAGRIGVSLNVGIDSESTLVVRADRQRLLQVLLNLLSNAVKYNHPGGRVEVTCEKTAPGRLRFVVSDTGRGIRPEDLARVFEPFDRLGAELTGPEGTGVGLPLSRQLTEHMGGRLEMSSEHGVGSTFFVELDAADDGGGLPKEVHRGERGASRRRPISSGTFRVLLVEDDLESLELVEQILRRRPDVEVIAAMHVGLGIELAREHKPDLILLDVALGEPAGATVLTRFLEDRATSVIPIAVIGTQPAAHQMREMLDRGVVGFLTKPIDVRGLLSVLDAVSSSRLQ